MTATHPPSILLVPLARTTLLVFPLVREVTGYVYNFVHIPPSTPTAIRLRSLALHQVDIQFIPIWVVISHKQVVGAWAPRVPIPSHHFEVAAGAAQPVAASDPADGFLHPKAAVGPYVHGAALPSACEPLGLTRTRLAPAPLGRTTAATRSFGEFDWRLGPSRLLRRSSRSSPSVATIGRADWLETGMTGLPIPELKGGLQGALYGTQVCVVLQWTDPSALLPERQADPPDRQGCPFLSGCWSRTLR
eukprot:TRINITY_DN3966_c0_g1_i2.p1 TRINITY_DN3966_c0_g1~~TRINITY_DN3966_c0_g1_i2.p1  ORF type:complete len:247 (+),score=0.98 TRINITY_DN3966_c0_g1_i2:84-824(+)